MFNVVDYFLESLYIGDYCLYTVNGHYYIGEVVDIYKLKHEENTLCIKIKMLYNQIEVNFSSTSMNIAYAFYDSRYSAFMTGLIKFNKKEICNKLMNYKLRKPVDE